MSFTFDQSNIIGEASIDLVHDVAYCFKKIPEGTGSGRYILVTVNKNGIPYNFDKNLFIAIGGKNSAGTNIYDECYVYEKNGINRVVIPLSNQISAAPGMGEYRIDFIDTAESTAVESFNFNILVTSAPYDIGGIVASNEYQALVTAVSNSNGWLVGNGVPDDGDGNLNDYYLDAVTGNIYNKRKINSDIVWRVTNSNIRENIHIRYAPTDNVSINDMTSTYSSNVRFIGINISASTTASTNKSDYAPWLRIRNEIASQTYEYQKSTNGTTPPTGTWSTTIPSNINDGEYLWVKITIVYEDGSHSSTPIYLATRNGVTGQAAKLETPTYDNSEANVVGIAQCIVTATGSDTSKILNFKFKNLKGERGTIWRSGTDITGAGRYTSYNSSNAYVYDYYIDVNTGNYYQCTETTTTDSKWEYVGSIAVANSGDMKSNVYANNTLTGVVDKAIELYGVTLVEGTLNTNTTSITLTNSAFVEKGGEGSSKYTYKIFTSDPNVRPLSCTITNGQAILTFRKQTSDLDVAIEIHKID